MEELSQTQEKTLNYILTHLEQSGSSPTLREIANHFQWKAVGSAQDVIAALRKKGHLLPVSPGKARQLIPTLWQQRLQSQDQQKEAASFFKVPLLGSIQAGHPHEAIEQSNSFCFFPYDEKLKSQSKNFFALSINGYSMINAGFLPNDQILVEKTTGAKDKDIVVAMVDQEVTVKRLAKQGSNLYEKAQTLFQQVIYPTPPAYLMPENAEFKPIPFGLHQNDCILGVVRSLFRKSV